MTEATEYTEAWTGFTNARKNWAYRQDQLPSTHPIAADNLDLEAVEVNFDGITYAKGASTLKQLVAWVGHRGVHSPACGTTSRPTSSRTPSSATCSPRWRRRPAASWTPGPASGCRPRASTRSPRSSRSTTNGAFTSFAVAQTAAPRVPHPPAAPHRASACTTSRATTWCAVPRSRSTSSATSPRCPTWSASSSPTWCCSTTATSPTPRSASTSARSRPPSTASTRSTTPSPGRCCGARPGT